MKTPHTVQLLSSSRPRSRPLSCQRGDHSWTRTFRPSEARCLICGLVTYCPVCFDEQHLPPAAHSRPFECSTHQTPVSLPSHPQEQEAHPS